jgi:hypothetical protein
VNDTTWLRLSLFIARDRLAIEYEDSLGHRAGPGGDAGIALWDTAEVLYRSGVRTVRWPRRATAHLIDLIARDRGPIAVRVRPPRELWTTDWADFACNVLVRLGVDGERLDVATEGDGSHP